MCQLYKAPLSLKSIYLGVEIEPLIRIYSDTNLPGVCIRSFMMETQFQILQHRWLMQMVKVAHFIDAQFIKFIAE